MPPPESYRFEVDLRFGELLSFQAFMLLFRLRLWVLALVYGVVLIYMIAQVLSGEVALAAMTKPFFIAFTLPIILVLVTLVGTKRHYTHVWEPQLPIRYSVDQDAISTTSSTSSSEIRWGGIQDVRSWHGLVLIFMNRHMALVIPGRCLGDGRHDFLRFVKQHIGSRLTHG